MKKLAYLPDDNALSFTELASDYVDSRVLAANAAKSFARPMSSSKIVLSANPVVGDVIKVNSVTLTAVAAAPTANQFIPSGTLALTLAAVAAQINGLTPLPAVTVTVTDGNTALTATNTTANSTISITARKGADGPSFGVHSHNSGAKFCRLSAGALFYYSVTGAATVAAADVSNGTGSVSVPSTVQPMFAVTDVTTISVIAPAGCVVSAEWWS